MIPLIVEQVYWTDSALKDFVEIVKWLKVKWSQKEVNNFVNKTEKLVAILQRYPESCRPSQKRKNVRIGILDKHTQIVYHYDSNKQIITILQFWGMKQNPNRFKY
jgi:plasmid stabilization system protein ParE